jgi:DNA replication initiation complex subunit (GINS family)
MNMSSDRELDETYRILLDVWKREITLPTLLKIESMERFIPRIKTLLQYLNDKLHHSSNPIFKQIILEYIERVKYLMEDIFETRFTKILNHTQNNIPIEEDLMFPFENECYKSISLGFKGYLMAKNFVLSPEQKHIGQFIKPNESLLTTIQNGMSATVPLLPDNQDQEDSQDLRDLEDQNNLSTSPIDENQSNTTNNASNGATSSQSMKLNDEALPVEQEVPQNDQNELSQIAPDQSTDEEILPETNSLASVEDIFSELNSIPEMPEIEDQNKQTSTLTPEMSVISENSTIDPLRSASTQGGGLSGNDKSPVQPVNPAVEQSAGQISEAIPNKSSKFLMNSISHEFDISIEYSVIRIISEVPELVGEDLRIYGPFCPEDVVSLPKSNADIIVSQRKAEIIKPII